MAAPETLAGVLALGPLPLAAGLRCGNEIASELRDLHQQAQAYGKLTASSVLLTESGAHLLPSTHYLYQAMPERDVRAFGGLLYQMLTGTAAPATPAAPDTRIRGAGTGPSRLRTAAIKVALKCLAPAGTPLSMQQVATELRLLSLLLRQYDANARTGRGAASAAAPFLLRAAPMAAFPMARWQGGARAVPPDFGHSTRHGEPGSERNPPAGETSAAPVVPLGPDSFGQSKAEAKAELQPAGGNCPKCGGPMVYASRARSPFERMLDRWQVPICRCHRCYHRYVEFAGLKIGKEMPVGTGNQVKPRRRRG